MSLTHGSLTRRCAAQEFPLGFQVITGWAGGADLAKNDTLPMQSAVPIFTQGRYLVARVPAELTDGDLAELRDSLVTRIEQSQSSGVIVDVSEVDVIDSFAARTLQDLANLTRRRGAPTVVVGIQPEVAHAMEKVGLALEETADDLAEGLAHLDAGAR